MGADSKKHIDAWFRFASYNSEAITPTQTALFCCLVWVITSPKENKKYEISSRVMMGCCGIKSYNTYNKTLKQLQSLGFIKIVDTASNQYTSTNIIFSPIK